MTNFEKESIIIRQICNYSEPGKKKLQKLMYLIERKGVQLDLNYRIHYFGPYSSKLDNMLLVLESRNEINIDTRGETHKIHLGEVEIKGKLDEHSQKIVDFVLHNFVSRSAYELEAITTIDYVANELIDGIQDENEIIERVKQIKGDKFETSFLKENYKLLDKLEFVSA